LGQVVGRRSGAVLWLHATLPSDRRLPLEGDFSETLLQRLQWLRLRIGISHCKCWSNVSEKHGHQFHRQHFNILSVLCLTDWKRSLQINETSFSTNSGQWTATSLDVNVFRYVVVLFFGGVELI